VGVLGCGNVGGPLIELLQRHGDDIAARTGLRLEVAAVAVRSASRERGVTLPDGVLTTDAAAVVGDPNIDVIVEVIGGLEPAGASYGDALAEAQSLGYAERDPTADVEGFDAGAKAAIIASIAFGARVVAGDVYHEGISGITEADIAYASRLGYVVKLLAIAEL